MGLEPMLPGFRVLFYLQTWRATAIHGVWKPRRVEKIALILEKRWILKKHQHHNEDNVCQV